MLLVEHATPTGLAASAFVSVFLAVLPLLSVHMVVILYVVSRLHLNKVMALAIQNICMPPFVPVLCVEVGHYLLYRQWITEVSLQVILWQLKDRVWEWLIGSLVVAPLLAAIVALVVFLHPLVFIRSGWLMALKDSVAARKIEVKHRGNALGFWFFRQALRCFGLRGRIFVERRRASLCFV